MDKNIDFLLELNGIIIEQEFGHWVKFVALKVLETAEKPHGISYSLTLHDEIGTRILGFDNAHSINKHVQRYQKKITEWDHEHKVGDSEKIYPYEFKTASQLVSDFWVAVDRALKESK